MNKKINTTLSLATAAAIVLAGAALPAFAETGLSVGLTTNASVTAAGTGIGASVKVNASANAHTKDMFSRADKEINRRTTALDALNARVSAMQKLSQSEKGSLSTDINSQLDEMNSLRDRINADIAANNTSSLRLDVQSITKAYRVFALVLPQGAIEAASDRVLTTANIMTDLGTKLSARISTAQSAGSNVSSSETAIADFNAKVSDAKIQATAAANEVSSLKPDGGNATIMASNTATLKDARAKIVASQKDLITARADARTIVKDLKINVSATASTTATSSVH